MQTQQPNQKLDVTGLNAVIKAQSTTYSIELEIPKDRLEQQFNLYWNEVKDVLPPDIVKAAQKGGFREVNQKRAILAAGGKGRFYQPVLAEAVNTYLETQPRQALAFNTIELTETVMNYIVRASVYLEPEVKWKKRPGIDEPLVVKMPKQPDNFIEATVASVIKQGQNDSVVLVPAADGTVSADGHVVVVDCESTINGEKWADGCVQGVKWPVDKQYHKQPEVYDLVVGLKAGESRSGSFKLNDRFGEDAGKEVVARIKVSQIYNKDVPAVDDDLAKNYGFQTLDAWRTAITNNVVEKTKTQKKNLLDISILSQLMTTDVVDVDPIPFVWMADKGKEIYANWRKRAKTEDDLVSMFKGATTTTGEPVVNKSTLLTYLAEMAAKSLLQDLVLRSWGKQADVKGDLILQNIASYVAGVRKKLEEIVKIEETDTTQEKTDATVSV